MQKIQIQTEIDIQRILDQMQTTDLETFLQEASTALVQRRAGDKKSKETRLLRRLNEECSLPEAHWALFRELQQKRAALSLSEAEQSQLDQLIREEEQTRLQRVLILGELAQLKGISIVHLAEQLGIHTIEE